MEEQPDTAGGSEFLQPAQALCIFTSIGTDKGTKRRTMAEVNAVAPATPKYMRWSDQVITWGREDHPNVMPTPGKYALVLDLLICLDTHSSCRFSKVLIDNGSSINILYRDSLENKLGIPASQLEKSRTVFHGIIPGLSCTPMGKITLDVVFGTKDNFRREPIEFEVVDLQSRYHALLGRLALVKFMAASFVSYLKMKLPGPNSIITVTGDYMRSLECAEEGSKIADAMVIEAEKQQIMRQVEAMQAADLAGGEKPAAETQFTTTDGTKRILLNPAQPDRYVTIGANLSPA